MVRSAWTVRRQGIVDEVDIVPRDQGFVGIGNIANAVFIGPRPGARPVARGNGDDFAIVAQPGRVYERRRCNFLPRRGFPDPDHWKCLVFVQSDCDLWTVSKHKSRSCLPRPNSA